MRPKVGFIGLGEVGETLAEDLLKAGLGDFSAFDPKFSDADSRPSRTAARLGIARRGSAAEVACADLVICAVTAAEDVAAAEAAAPGMANGFFLDLNSASPGAKSRAAAIIEAAGGRYVESAVMSPIGPKRIGAPMLLGGPHAEAFLALARPLGFSGASVFSETLGKASAAKMCRSVMVKGIEALLTESLLAARHYDVLDTVVGSLSDLFPLPNWPELSRYMISRSVEHGARRAEEMRESARTVAEAGVAPLITAAIAERQDATAGFSDSLAEKDLAGFLDALSREMKSS
jgi:3-hydroxyisobutyrate dehydrogenase-like beta-hydroxyacid dehydrogenase